MHIEEIFYGIFWVSMISVVWFYTDWFVQYSQLFNIGNNLRILYQAFQFENPNAFFTDFLYYKSTNTKNKLLKFVLKLISCPFCLGVWLALGFCFVFSNPINTAPVYIGALFVTLQIKKLL